MFKTIRRVLAQAFRAILDGVRTALGIKEDSPELIEQTASRGTAVVCFAGAALVRMLPFPGAPAWSESLFAVGLGLWNFNKMKELT